MVENKETTSTGTAYGKALKERIPFEFEWPTYETEEEFLADKNGPMTVKEQMTARNAEAKAKARSAALTKALDNAGHPKPTEKTNDQLRLKNMFRTLKSSKLYTDQEAKDLAAKTLNLTWAK